MDDERLRKTLPAFPQYIVRDQLRDDLISYILEEPGVWYSDESGENPVDKVAVMQVGGFVDNALREEFFLSPDDPDISRLSKAIFRKSTRYLVADLFERVTKIEKSQRGQGGYDGTLLWRCGCLGSGPFLGSPSRLHLPLVGVDFCGSDRGGRLGPTWLPPAYGMMLCFSFPRPPQPPKQTPRVSPGCRV